MGVDPNLLARFVTGGPLLSFGNDDKIKALTAEESEKHIKYIDLLADAVILDNTFQLSKLLNFLPFRYLGDTSD